MIEDQREQKILIAKIRTQIFKQIFKDLNQNDLEGRHQFYIIYSNEGAELQFLSGAKSIMITIILKKNIFASYMYNIQKKYLHKYLLEDFILLGFFFENNKVLLDMEIAQHSLVLSYKSKCQEGGLGGWQQTQFVGPALDTNQDDEQRLIVENQIRPQQQNYMQVTLLKWNDLQGILRFARSQKVQNLFFHYNSIKKNLQISDKIQNPDVMWSLKISEISKHNFSSDLSFNCKRLSLAINLLDHDKALILTFYPSFLLLNLPQQEKSFTIRINANKDFQFQS